MTLYILLTPSWNRWAWQTGPLRRRTEGFAVVVTGHVKKCKATFFKTFMTLTRPLGLCLPMKSFLASGWILTLQYNNVACLFEEQVTNCLAPAEDKEERGLGQCRHFVNCLWDCRKCCRPRPSFNVWPGNPSSNVPRRRKKQTIIFWSLTAVLRCIVGVVVWHRWVVSVTHTTMYRRLSSAQLRCCHMSTTLFNCGHDVLLVVWSKLRGCNVETLHCLATWSQF